MVRMCDAPLSKWVKRCQAADSVPGDHRKMLRPRRAGIRRQNDLVEHKFPPPSKSVRTRFGLFPHECLASSADESPRTELLVPPGC